MKRFWMACKSDRGGSCITSYIRPCCWVVITLLFSCQRNQKETADLVFLNGSILTVESETPQYVEAIAIKDGKVIYVGDNHGVRGFVGNETESRDLKGRFMMPGFVVGHSHLVAMASLWNGIHIDPPPRGEVANLQQLLDTLQSVFQQDRPAFLLATGYDEGRFSSGERRHPTREDLDKISSDTPIVVLHGSLRQGVANTRALELAGVLKKGFSNPSEGEFMKDASGRFNGVFREGAVFSMLPIFPLPKGDEQVDCLRAAIHHYLANGITTAQEGDAMGQHIRLFKEADSISQLPLDVVAYLEWSEFDKLNAGGQLKPGQYDGRFKLGGVKIRVGGGFRKKSDVTIHPNDICPSIGIVYADDARLSYQEFSKLIRKYHENNVQAIVQSYGDSAAGWMMDAMREAERNKGKRDLRYAMIQSQSVSVDQLDQMKELRVYPMFFPLYTYYWGDQHRTSATGVNHDRRISPLQSALKRKLIFGIHTDAPLTSISQFDAIQSAVVRSTSSGFILDEGERVDVFTALKASTIWGAYLYREENRKGSIVKGKLADLIILDADPLKVNPKDISKIRVLETIKEGTTVHQLERW